MKYLVLLMLTLNINAAIFVSKTCSEDQKDMLIKDTKKSRADMKGIIKDLRQYKKQNPYMDMNVEKKINKAIVVMKCSLARTYWTKHKCVEPYGGAIAYTYAVIGKTVYITPSYWDYDIEGRQGIVLHELTHKCGTGDADYFWTRKPKDTNGTPWSDIADTYRYWQQNGTCIPEIDC
ncbi:M35 family metallo-endopeptidase [Halobacteriovorax sp. ZH5_bin.2]|uniref:M35 family metallo-endopeptidase n=1 Tax=unclassified Halobacteriovorax TaxID=2639665 RepID=UPI003715478E